MAARVEFAYGYSYAQVLLSCFGLNAPLLGSGFFWQPVTYLFLHANAWHLGFNMATVLLFGSGVEREVGSGRFWQIFLVGGMAAGFGWLAVALGLSHLPPFDSLTHWMPQALRQWIGAGDSAGRSVNAGLLIGASGGVFALIASYGTLFPKRVVYMFMPVPVRMKARTLVLLLVALDLAAAVFVQSHVAYAAHLSGCFAGYLLGLRLRRLGYADDE